MAVEIEVPAADKVEVRFVCPDGSGASCPLHMSCIKNTATCLRTFSTDAAPLDAFTPETIGRLMENLCYEYEQHVKAERPVNSKRLLKWKPPFKRLFPFALVARRNARWFMDAEGTKIRNILNTVNRVLMVILNITKGLA